MNLFPEINRKDSPTQMTHYQRPGLVPLVSPAAAAIGRGIYQASNGDGYVAIGTTLYWVDSSWALHTLGSLTSIASSSTSMISMVDNGDQLLVVAGAKGAGNATGTITWVGNPANGDTATLNGVVWTFKTSPVNPTDIQIAGSLTLTIINLRVGLIASVNPSIVVGYYNSSGGVLQVTSIYPGARGTSYTLASSVGTPSAATLTIGTIFPGTGWRVDLGDRTGSTFTSLSDAAWTGADRVDFIDTFIVWNVPGTAEFGSTVSTTIEPLDPTYVASKTSWPDPLVGLVVCETQLFLFGQIKSEIWYDAGGAAFPFARQSGVSITHGCVAKYSIVAADLDVFWLSADLQGKGVVLRVRGTDVKRISNFALEYAISQMSDITDAVGYCFLQAGHLFYVLSFPSANQTWVWDASVTEPELGWSQRGWMDSNGGFNRDRGVVGCAMWGKCVVLDWENGTIYEQRQASYVDTLQTISGGVTTAQDYPITYLRTFPHLMSGTDPATGQPILANGKIVQHDRFAIDVSCGNVADGVEPQFSLRYSDDRGASWTGEALIHAGKRGEYGTRPDVRRLGQAMDRVYEVSWNFAGEVALNGAWVEGKVMNQ